MTTNKKSFGGLLACLLSILGLQAAQAAYQEPASYTNPPKIINIGSPGYSASDTDDSAVFQKAIDDVAAAGGGVVWVPKGDYRVVGLNMKSNVHMKIKSGSTVTLHANGYIVNFSGGITNTSFRGAGGRIVVNIPAFTKPYFANATGVDNMLIANINIEDPHSAPFPGIVLSWDRNDGGTPKNLSITNISNVNKEHYGYGIVQAHAVRDSKFNNLEGHGGVPLRFETGWSVMNLAKAGGVFNVTANNITSQDGQAAVMLQPHTINNGNVTMSSITAVGSEFAVLSEMGGTWKYTAQEIQDYNLSAGKFGNVSITNAKATYKGSGVPTRWVHLDYYPLSELQKVYKDSNEIEGYSGPSITVFGNFGTLTQLTTSQISGIGAFVNPLTLTSGYNHPNSAKNRPPLP